MGKFRNAVCLVWVLAISGAASARAADGFAVIGDAGKATTGSRLVRDSVKRLGVSKLILPGDNLYSSTYASVWKPWRDLGMTFDVVAIGNHNDGYRNEMAYFAMPNEYFSKVIGDARYVVLNSDNDRSGGAQATWLDRELSTATEPFIFLVFHHPNYTISGFHDWREKATFQQAIRPVIWKYRSKLTALLVGHDHLASVLHYNDLPVMLSGAVQEYRRDRGVDYTSDGVHVKTNWYFDDNNYWAHLTFVPAAGSAPAKTRVDFIRAKDDHVGCTVFIATGKAAELQPNCATQADPVNGWGIAHEVSAAGIAPLPASAH